MVLITQPIRGEVRLNPTLSDPSSLFINLGTMFTLNPQVIGLSEDIDLVIRLSFTGMYIYREKNRNVLKGLNLWGLNKRLAIKIFSNYEVQRITKVKDSLHLCGMLAFISHHNPSNFPLSGHHYLEFQ